MSIGVEDIMVSEFGVGEIIFLFVLIVIASLSVAMWARNITAYFATLAIMTFILYLTLMIAKLFLFQQPLALP